MDGQFHKLKIYKLEVSIFFNFQILKFPINIIVIKTEKKSYAREG